MNRGAAYTIASLALLATVLLAWLAREQLASEPPLPVLDTLGGDFELLDTSGRVTRLADFRGEVVLLNFGFTSCPDVCPTVLARMRESLRALGPDASDVRPVFVTIDPARDTAERLAPYLAHFGPRFVGLHGTDAQLREAAARFKVFIERTPLPPPLDYGFAHSDQIYLIDRDSRVRATFGGTTVPAEIATAVRRALRAPRIANGRDR